MAELVPLHRLAQLMGHDSLDTTMIYIQATRSDLQKEVEKIAWCDSRGEEMFTHMLSRAREEGLILSDHVEQPVENERLSRPLAEEV